VGWGHVTEYPETVDAYIEFATSCEDEITEEEQFQHFFDVTEVLRRILEEEGSQAKTLHKCSVTGTHHRRFDMNPSLSHNCPIIGDALMRLVTSSGKGVCRSGKT
jgi:hypothetical protein